MYGAWEMFLVENGRFCSFPQISCQFFHTQYVRKHGKEWKQFMVAATPTQTTVMP
jgi:hypothetical protein